MKTVLAFRSDEAGRGCSGSRRTLPNALPICALAVFLGTLAWPQQGYSAAYFFHDKLAPPPTGMYMSTGGWSAVYATGVVLQNVAQRGVTQSVLPPPPIVGAAVTNTFSCQWELDLSTNGGANFAPAAAAAEATFRLAFSHMSGDVEIYDAEMLSLEVPVLPSLLIRESPTLASPGLTTIQPIGDGHLIDSFFDIYTEVSTDGGLTWWPASYATRLRLKPDPALLPEVASPRPLAPLPNGEYTSPDAPWQAYPNGYALWNVSHRLFTQWQALPPPGASSNVTFDSRLDFTLSATGVPPSSRKRAPATMTFAVHNVREFSGQTSYETEATQLTVAGGDLSPGIMIRESPTRASLGGATLSAGGGGGGGGYNVSSFFDVFTEISLDSGQTWTPATNGPARMVLGRIAPANEFESPLQPTPCGRYLSSGDWFSAFASGIVFSNLTLSAFSQSIPPPAPGTTTNHSFVAWVEALVSLDGARTFQETSGSGLLTVRTAARLGSDGVTDYYDTEMQELDVALAGLPGPLQLRESPTCASLGRTTASSLAGGGYQIDSFFDIFTEVSLDGGLTWEETALGAGTVILLSPEPLTITCTTNITVRAPTRAGAAVTYPCPTVSGGCPPVTVTCVPPSGSLFPLGVTAVSCVASDACANVATCAFTVTVLRPLRKHFFYSDHLPPPAGMYVPAETQAVAFANGMLLRNPAHRLFSSGIPPPPPGPAVTHAFGSTVELEVSADGGLTWAPYSVAADTSVSVTNKGPSGADTLYGAEVLALAISGGSLPPGVMVRESPTLHSSGETRIEALEGGFMIDSFFDIFLEVSLDGGATWSPALQPCEMELKPDPALIPPAASPRALEPMPNGQYASGASGWMGFANGVRVRDVRNRLFTQWGGYPPLGVATTCQFDAQLYFQLSTDGGATWNAAKAPGTLTCSCRNARLFSGRSTFETAVMQLDVYGGDLPSGVMLRESPTRASEGGVDLEAAGGGYAISSFFDIFTEISVDGGQTWAPATNGPVRLSLERVAPASEYASDLQPPPASRYVHRQSWSALYAPGIALSNLMPRAFSGGGSPPSPGSTATHTFDAQVEMEVSYDAGSTWSHASAPATITAKSTGRLGGDGATEYYDTEMLQLDIGGGTLPSYILIRESPTRASQGRTTSTSASGGTVIDSFFDIYTEISLDGGLTWHETMIGPALLVLEPDRPLEILCPDDKTVPATDWSGRIVNFPLPATTGGVPPVVVICSPPSGSLFPIGTTPVLCEAEDVVGQSTSCWFNVNVIKVTEIDDFPHSIGRLTLQGPTGGSETIILAGSSRMEAYIGPSGEASDTDLDGLDEVAVELTDYTLRGYSAMLGKPVTVSRATGFRTPGKHEETANNTTGILDVPPFTPAGTCESFFDIYAEIAIGSQVLSPSASFLIQRLIHHKPPAPGEKYVTLPQLSLPLLDETGKPSGVNLTAFSFVPATTAETDLFAPVDTYLVMRLPSGRYDTVRLTGTAKICVYFEGAEGQAQDSDSDGLEDAVQELCGLSLSGTCSAGLLTLQLSSSPISLGLLEERVNNNAGLLDVQPFAASGDCDSFFDVFFLWTIATETFHNVSPWRLSGVITHKPCVPGDILAGTPETPLDLVDESGGPTLVQAVKQWLALKPPDLNIKPIQPAQVHVSWPNPSTSYRLESCETLMAPPLWQVVTNTPAVGGDGRLGVNLDRAPTNLFFRLYRPLP